MKKLIALLLLMWGLCLVVGCTKECTTCPEAKPPSEKEYYFLYNYVSTNYWVYTYSTKDGRAVDSTLYGYYPFDDVCFSSDGKYAYYSQIGGAGGTRSVWVTDWNRGDTLAITTGIGGHRLSLTSDGKYLLVSRTPNLAILDASNLNVLFSKEQIDSWGGAAIHPHRNLAYVPKPTGGTIGSQQDSLLILDFQSFPVHYTKVGLRSVTTGKPVIGGFASMAKGGLYLVLHVIEVDYPYYAYLQLRDPETMEVLREYRSGLLWSPEMVVHPDGERMFLVAPVRFNYANPGEVWELNLRTSLLRRVLDGTDFKGNWPFQGLNPSDIEITPDGKYALIANGGEGLEYGPIMKVDLESYRIVDAFYPSPGVSRRIRINPQVVKDGE